MEYRIIDITCKNEKIDKILHNIGYFHNLIPKIWNPSYRVTEQNIQESIDRINKTNKDDLYIAVAEDVSGSMQGYIWAYKVKEPTDSVMILSLYVADAYRGKGIATNLKNMLEDWCKDEGIKKINTTVHCDNKNMLKLNRKLGYKDKMINMTKEL